MWRLFLGRGGDKRLVCENNAFPVCVPIKSFSNTFCHVGQQSVPQCWWHAPAFLYCLFSAIAFFQYVDFFLRGLHTFCTMIPTARTLSDPSYWKMIAILYYRSHHVQNQIQGSSAAGTIFVANFLWYCSLLAVWWFPGAVILFWFCWPLSCDIFLRKWPPLVTRRTSS